MSESIDYYALVSLIITPMTLYYTCTRNEEEVEQQENIIPTTQQGNGTATGENDNQTLSNQEKRQIIADSIITKKVVESTDLSTREISSVRSLFGSNIGKDEKSEGSRILDSFRSAIQHSNRSVLFSDEIHTRDETDSYRNHDINDIEMQSMRTEMTKDKVCVDVDDNICKPKRYKRNIVARKLSHSLGNQGSDMDPVGCNICLMDFEVGEEIGWSRNPQCIHGFHKECIVDWLSVKNECPICRRDYMYQNKEDK